MFFIEYCTVHLCLLVVNMGGQLVISFVLVVALMMRGGPSLWTFALVMSFLLSLSLITIFYNWENRASLVKRWSHPPTQVCTCSHVHADAQTHTWRHMFWTHTHTHIHNLNAITILTPIHAGHTHTVQHTHIRCIMNYVVFFSLFVLFISPHHQLLHLMQWHHCALWTEVDGPVLLPRPRQRKQGRCLLLCTKKTSHTTSSRQNPETLLSLLH